MIKDILEFEIYHFLKAINYLKLTNNEWQYKKRIWQRKNM